MRRCICYNYADGWAPWGRSSCLPVPASSGHEVHGDEPFSSFITIIASYDNLICSQLYFNRLNRTTSRAAPRQATWQRTYLFDDDGDMVMVKRVQVLQHIHNARALHVFKGETSGRSGS